MRIAGITQESFVDGPGLRVVIFAQGCDLACPHCQNPESWQRDGGEEYTVNALVRTIKQINQGKKAVRGVTFSGGEPFMQAEEFAKVAEKIKKLGWDIATYTGHTYEALLAKGDNGINALLANTDYLIDGPYIHAQRSLDIKFRGSTNQRIIDMNATRKRGEVQLFSEE